MNYEHIKDTTKCIQNTLKVLDKAVKKREFLRNYQFYSIFGNGEDIKRQLLFMNAVVKRLENKIKRLIKTIEE